MPTLTDYQTETLELLHDPSNTYFSQTDVNLYINRARIRIAGRSQAVRFLGSGGTIVSLAITAPGSGYAGTITVAISGAGQQASATATQSGGAINAVTLVNGGWGYITGTTTTITVTGSGGGSGAIITPTIDNSLTMVPGQEVYQFNLVNTLIAAQTVFPGIDKAFGLISVAGAWGANAAMKPMLMQMIWSEFQAYYRSYNTGLQSYPTVWSQYGQGISTGSGVGGSIYLWPLPSQSSQMDWDVWCKPVLMTQGGSQTEALPEPWTTAVPYYAAYLGYLNAQRPEDAKMMKTEYDERVKEAVTETHDAFVGNYYEGDTYSSY